MINTARSERLVDMVVSIVIGPAIHRLRIALLPKDMADERSVILEVRAGTGGDEASLFAGDLYRMYARYAERRAKEAARG